MFCVTELPDFCLRMYHLLGQILYFSMDNLKDFQLGFCDRSFQTYRIFLHYHQPALFPQEVGQRSQGQQHKVTTRWQQCLSAFRICIQWNVATYTLLCYFIILISLHRQIFVPFLLIDVIFKCCNVMLLNKYPSKVHMCNIHNLVQSILRYLVLKYFDIHVPW